MKKLRQFILSFLFSIFSVPFVSAHCPLCTMGAAVVGGGAVLLGVKTIVVGVFIGAMAVSTGYWFGRLIKKRYVPLQKHGIIFLSFGLTIIPLMKIFSEVFPLYVSWFGGYGTLFNSTYVVNSFLAGSVFGGITLMISPWISNQITNIRNGNKMPYQGVAVTMLMLIVVSAIIQVVA